MATSPLLLRKQPKETELYNFISIILTNLDFISGCAVTLSKNSSLLLPPPAIFCLLFARKTFPYKHRPINTEQKSGHTPARHTSVTQRFLHCVSHFINVSHLESIVSSVQGKKTWQVFKNGCNNLKRGQFKGVM